MKKEENLGDRKGKGKKVTRQYLTDTWGGESVASRPRSSEDLIYT